MSVQETLDSLPDGAGVVVRPRGDKELIGTLKGSTETQVTVEDFLRLR